MQIATWNVNSIRSRLQIVTDWLNQNPVDVLCLAWCYFMTPAKISQFQGKLIVANNWIG